MKRLFIGLFAVLVVLSLGLGLQPAQAANVSWTVTSLNSIGCNSSNIGFTTDVSGITSFPTTLHFLTTVDAGGIRYMDEDAGTPGTDGNYSWHLYYSNSGGPATNAWPITPNTLITVHFDLIKGPGGPVVFSDTVVLSKCNGGSIVSQSAGGTSGPGPEIPAGFVLRTITCNVGVYDAPGGSVVSGAVVTGGQTWFVNPVPVKAAGKSWTEIFVGGFTDGFIPTSCQH